MRVDADFISGCMLGIEFPSIEGETYFVVDLFILRIIFEFHKRA